jgi:hypothetical protein
MQVNVRPAAVAGMFYPRDGAALTRDVLGHLRRATARAERRPKVLLAPHAGYVYSGAIAANAYATLAPYAAEIRRVVLLGPTHRVAVRGIAVPSVDAFETPLGFVRIDREAIGALADLPYVGESDAAHAQEHSLEVQLPFLQSLLYGFSLVPLAVGRAAPEHVHEVIERLWGGDETLIVISSDLSHYLPYDQAVARDRSTVERVLQFAKDLQHDEACGATPLAGALLAARAHGLQPRLLDLRNSGDTAGDKQRVVGYCSISFEPAAKPARASDEGDAEVGAALLARARNAIAAAFSLPLCDEPPHAALGQRGATFVTLRRGGRLRGCIGTLQAHQSLEADVRQRAHAAAFRDSRFEPLAREEFDDLEIEVSVLSSPMPVEAASEADALAKLTPGVDGVILQWRGQGATFLPQVWDELPERAQFIAALKRKAGLAADFWAEDVRIARYTVRKYGAA